MKVKFILLSGLSLFLLSSCANVFEDRPKEFYTKNYGGFEDPPSDNTAILAPEDLPREDASSDASDDTGKPPEVTEQTQTDATGDTTLIRETSVDTLERQKAEKAAALDGKSLEEKLFLLIKECYETRDRFCFDERISLFYSSFPYSNYSERIRAMQNSFYFSPGIDTANLDRGILEIETPFFSTREEMASYFKKIASYGIKAVMWSPFQTDKETTVLFSKRKHDYGAYFKTNTVPQLEDVLGEMLALTQKYGIKFHVKLPMRNHPWLQFYNSLLMTQSWDSVKLTEYYYPKLNFFHPYAEEYFLSLLHDLMQYPIDGITFEDDYTYALEEGFSTLNRILYEDETNINIRPIRFFNDDILKLRKKEFAVSNLPSDRQLRDYTQWKMEGIQKFLLKAIDEIQSNRSDLQIGLEMTPDMVVNPRAAFYWYSMTGNNLAPLPVNFFVMDWKKPLEVFSAPENEYKKALNFMERNKNPEQEIVIKALLNNKSEGVRLINDSIRYSLGLANEINENRILISAVNRRDNTDIVFSLK